MELEEQLRVEKLNKEAEAELRRIEETARAQAEE